MSYWLISRNSGPELGQRGLGERELDERGRVADGGMNRDEVLVLGLDGCER